MSWLKPLTAVIATVILTSASLFFSLASRQSRVYAEAPKVSSSSQTASLVPLEKLSLDELKYQLTLGSTNLSIARNMPSIGVFDPRQELVSDKPYIRHVFIDWRDDTLLARQLYISKRLNAAPLVTILPDGEPDGQKLLLDISSGVYDARIMNLLDVVKSSNNTVYVRFAHEMDLGNLYPWGDKDPATFIAAFRHVVGLARFNKVSNINWVWSPAGNGVAARYYPGDDVVDTIGVTILHDQYWYGDSHLTFKELSSIRDWIKQYNKPVWIVEFGAGNADPIYQHQLINDALAHFQEYGYSALVYINIDDSNINGPSYHLNRIQDFDPSLVATRGSFMVVKIQKNISKTNPKQDKINDYKTELNKRSKKIIGSVKSSFYVLYAANTNLQKKKTILAPAHSITVISSTRSGSQVGDTNRKTNNKVLKTTTSSYLYSGNIQYKQSAKSALDYKTRLNDLLIQIRIPTQILETVIKQ